jgi:2,4-dienoyl-CoA reductase-like NADH-dependent reductase (Old Yellow Enzyme family)
MSPRRHDAERTSNALAGEYFVGDRVTGNGFPHLLAPLGLRGHRLRNRIVLTAHTTSFGQDGVPGARARAYYEARAAGGAGLIVMEPLPVHPTGGVTPQNYRFDDDRFVPALRRVVDAVHRHGTTFVSQLYHLGANADETATLRERWGPSERAVPGGPGMLHVVDEVDIAELLDGHERAARTAVAAGVDGVECMFAYDTLVDGFMAARWNHREDGYGGPLLNRMRLAREILAMLRAAIGPDRLLGVTLSAGLEEYVQAAEHLAAYCDLDYLAIGNGSYDAPHLLIPPMGTELGMGIAYAARVKARTSAPAIIAEGRINHPDLAEHALRDGACDLVGMTRALIADPEMPAKAAAGAVSTIRPCIADNLCIARRIRKFPIACLQNPDAGFEAEAPQQGGGRRVVVVGGGVAGLEAARHAAELGESVTLFEREQELGGQVRMLAALPGREEYGLAVEWRERELGRLGVEVRCGSAPSADEIAELLPDLVVVATGSKPPMPCADGVLSPSEVLGGNSLPPGAVVIIDEEGNHKGMGIAELLARRGLEVTLVPVCGPVGAELAAAFVLPLALERLVDAGVRVVEGHTAAQVKPGHVLLRRRYDGATQRLEAPVVIHAARQRAHAELVPALRSRGLVAVAVGDARAPRQVADAIREGYAAVAAPRA